MTGHKEHWNTLEVYRSRRGENLRVISTDSSKRNSSKLSLRWIRSNSAKVQATFLQSSKTLPSSKSLISLKFNTCPSGIEGNRKLFDYPSDCEYNACPIHRTSIINEGLLVPFIRSDFHTSRSYFLVRNGRAKVIGKLGRFKFK